MAHRLFFLLLMLARFGPATAQAPAPLVVETQHLSLVLAVGDNHRLYQRYLGPRLAAPADYARLAGGHEAYPPAGLDNLFEPAVGLTHADGNASLELQFVDAQTAQPSPGVRTTTVRLRDPKYPVEVLLHYAAYAEEDVIKTWTEIKHQERKAVVLNNYASAMLHFQAPQYWLTQFHGDWAEEMRQQEAPLTSGSKVLDSKLGTRADMYQTPAFFLALGRAADETSGDVLAGTLGWTGNFRLAFELDNQNDLRISAGINPYASAYTLPPNQVFTTPEFIFTYSTQGKGQASRNLHRWARRYGVLDGTQPRLTLLNNWESTYFDFNEPKLDGLMAGAGKLGVDLFLLDDGWFGNKYPRSADNAGLGDWQPTRTKLPNGLGHLVQEATKNGIKFGIWLEPEMVNPKSELYEQHPDWLLRLPNRPEDLSRNQLVLDLNNPQVQDFVFHTVADVFAQNPGLAYVKWDCNRPMTNAYSRYLGPDQSHLYVDYVRGFYKVCERLRQQYPHLPIMLCSGGGGRTDYGALKYFTEFWPSDNTDAVERVFIQWGYSNFFPALTLACHVTNWNPQQSLKFRTDVAMMGKLGYDVDLAKLTPAEMAFSQQAVQAYKRLSPVVWQGDQYRLRSPYESNQPAVVYVAADRARAVLFAYNLHTRFHETVLRTRLQGLDPARRYRVAETNLLPGTPSNLADQGQSYSGDYLMQVGLKLTTDEAPALTSHVLELTAE